MPSFCHSSTCFFSQRKKKQRTIEMVRKGSCGEGIWVLIHSDETTPWPLDPCNRALYANHQANPSSFNQLRFPIVACLLIFFFLTFHSHASFFIHFFCFLSTRFTILFFKLFFVSSGTETKHTHATVLRGGGGVLSLLGVLVPPQADPTTLFSQQEKKGCI